MEAPKNELFLGGITSSLDGQRSKLRGILVGEFSKSPRSPSFGIRPSLGLPEGGASCGSLSPGGF